MVKAIRIDGGHPDVVWEVQCRKHSLVDRRHEEFASQVCFYLLFCTHTDFVPSHGVRALVASYSAKTSSVSSSSGSVSPKVRKRGGERSCSGISSDSVVAPNEKKANGEKKSEKPSEKKKKVRVAESPCSGRRKAVWLSVAGRTIAALRRC